MSYIDQLADLEWSEADLANRMRNTVASEVSDARQDELRTIMLGHIAGLRAATNTELAEIYHVKNVTEQAGLELIAARADMALLRSAWVYEAAQKALGDDPSDHQAQAVIDAASPTLLDLVQRRAAERP